MPKGTMLSLIAVAGLALGVPAAAQGNAQGTPQRSSEVPPGLAKQLLIGNPGILRALVATGGSNSRLQDLPDSP